MASDYEIKQHQPLRLKKKFYEFYTAPITKFWADSMAYMFFLVMFTYTVLVKMEPTPCWQEIYSIAYIATLGCEKVREIISSEPVAITHKFSVWAWNMWNPCDGAAIILFLIGLSLRFRPATQDIGRVIYCVDSIYWYLRILNILGVNKYLGPLVTMMGKMVKNMIYYLVLLLVVLMSFGVSRQAILYPDKDAAWSLIKEVYFQPYFMLYGEVFASDIDPPCSENPNQRQCVAGHWITPITMSIYLLIANILLINLLIAVFNNIFNEVNAVSHQVWMFQRFTVVMEYQQKPVLPAPFIAFCHFYSLLKYCIRKAKGLEIQRDNGLKLFLEKDDLERLYDFEEECVEGFFHEQEHILNQSTEERIKSTTERVENMSQKIEDINQKENLQTATVQNIEFRLRKFEETQDQILSTLAVIHRFMSQHTSLHENLAASTNTLPTIANDMAVMRTISENENMQTLQVVNKRKFNRSLTEVRPDAYIFDDGTHFEVVPVPEECEDIIKSRETLYDSVVARKISTHSEDSDSNYPPNSSQRPSTCDTIKRTPYLNIRQDTGNSTESKDTLTPLGTCDDPSMVDVATGDSQENLMEMTFENAKQRAIRQRMFRRNSESGSGGQLDVSRSRLSLNQGLMQCRQLSLTQSEPDSAKDVPIKVIPSKQKRFLQLHSEYTSITDELENVCHLITSPTISLSSQSERQKKAKEMSKAEQAALLEKKHLKECEESDYNMLANLFKARSSIDETDTSQDGLSFDFNQRAPLRRDPAVDISPSKSRTPSMYIDETSAFIKNERFSARAYTADTTYPYTNKSAFNGRSSSELLNPPDGSSKIFKKSNESLQKGSSTETDYSLNPYKIIKQNSNDTTASLTTGSFNFETPSFMNDLSIDVDVGPIGGPSNTPQPLPPRTFSVGASDIRKTSRQISFDSNMLAPPSKSSILKKQYSVDQTKLSPKKVATEFDSKDISPVTKPHSSIYNAFRAFKSGKGLQRSSVTESSSGTPTKPGVNILKESSSSTDGSREDASAPLPTISTNLVQDEIAKLSSNIKSSTESEKDPPFNETMC